MAARAYRGKMRRRIEEILSAMATGQWNKILSPPAFAKKWSDEDRRACALKTVQNYAAHAATLLQVLYTHDDEIRVTTLARLDFVCGAAIARSQFRIAIEACRVLLGSAESRIAQREAGRALEQALGGTGSAPRELRIVYAPGTEALPAAQQPDDDTEHKDKTP